MEVLRQRANLRFHGELRKFPSEIQLTNFFFQILYTSLTIISYLFAICLIFKERHNQLPSVPTRGHGIVLLIFFTLTFIAQNLALVNINSKDWWFEMETRKDRIEMALFVTRYICTLFIFVLGLKAPGITSVASEDEEVLVDNENNVSFDSNLPRNSTYLCFSSRTTSQLSETVGRS
jgi:ATP-binding cassette subfamily B (MDR/TAP) protein 6/ABC transporter ATM